MMPNGDGLDGGDGYGMWCFIRPPHHVQHSLVYGELPAGHLLRSNVHLQAEVLLCSDLIFNILIDAKAVK